MASRVQRGRYMSRGFLNLRIYRGPSVWLVYILGKDICSADSRARRLLCKLASSAGHWACFTRLLRANATLIAAAVPSQTWS